MRKKFFINSIKRIIFSLFLLIISCNKKEKTTEETPKTVKMNDTVQLEKEVPPKTNVKTYSNERFRNVTVEKLTDDTFRVKGEGQIFEANFNWIVEDGHDELKKGNEMTDAGAPEWGKFDFTIDVAKNRENSTLMLIIFESSAKYGSRQHELPIVLF
jgi:hypothetical protein